MKIFSTMNYLNFIFCLLVVIFLEANAENTTSLGDDDGILRLIKARRTSIFEIDRVWSDAGDFIDSVFYSLGLTGKNLDECTMKVLEILIPSHERAPVETQRCYENYVSFGFMHPGIFINPVLADSQINLRKCIVGVNENFQRAVMKAINRISDCEL